MSESQGMKEPIWGDGHADRRLPHLVMSVRMKTHTQTNGS